MYRNVLRLKNMDSNIYLTVPLPVYDTFFQRKGVQAAMKDAQVKVIIIDVDSEEIVSWIN
jgi:XisH protein